MPEFRIIQNITMYNRGDGPRINYIVQYLRPRLFGLIRTWENFNKYICEELPYGAPRRFDTEEEARQFIKTIEKQMEEYPELKPWKKSLNREITY